MLTLSVAVPMIERGSMTAESAVESQHDPARCGHGHDHRICAQVGANLSVATAVHPYRLPHVTVRLRRPIEPSSTLIKSFLSGPHSRAPPLA
jgi:hypothetical protein